MNVQKREEFFIYYKMLSSLSRKTRINWIKYLLELLKKEGKIYNDASLGSSCWRIKQ